VAKKMSSPKAVTLILGAGFSYWAASLPLVRSLFDSKIDILNDREERRLKKVEIFKAKWDKDHPGVNPEQFIEHILRNGTVSERKLLLWYITRRLSDPFLATITRGIQTLMIDDSRKTRLPEIRKATEFFEYVGHTSLAGIVTPNYDLLVEYSLGTSSFNYGMLGKKLYGRGKNHIFPWQGAWPTLKGALPVAKVHGSLSWMEDGTHFTDGRCGLKGKAHIVPPIPEKARPPELNAVWQLAERILKASAAILVFGFAFNPYDKALLELLKSGDDVKNVLLVDPLPNVDAARKIWPGSQIKTCSPPPGSWSDIREWLDGV